MNRQGVMMAPSFQRAVWVVDGHPCGVTGSIAQPEDWTKPKKHIATAVLKSVTLCLVDAEQPERHMLLHGRSLSLPCLSSNPKQLSDIVNASLGGFSDA